MRISDWSSDVCSSDLLCKSLQHRVAADTQATKIIEQREAEEAPLEGHVSGADGASLNGADGHAREGSPGNFVRTRRSPVNPARVASSSERPPPAIQFAPKLRHPRTAQARPAHLASAYGADFNQRPVKVGACDG